jgi:ATP-binding cassette subfamily C protein
MPFRDLDQIRAFLMGAGPIAIVDMPWLPLFVILCGLIHPWLGGLAAAGAVALVALTILAERASRVHARAIASTSAVRWAVTEAARRNGQATLAMGMRSNLGHRWAEANDRFVAAVQSSSDTLGAYGSASKIVRLTLQSVMLGLGAYLVIRQELTSGAMIAASIMMGRALAPVELAIANWRGFVAARESIRRLSSVFSSFHADPACTALPGPSNSLEVAIAVAAPGSGALILPNVQFRLSAGEVLGIIGPSGSGKTSLARAIVGTWSPTKGSVRLDGASLDQWAPEARGRHIGYVSQDIELFDGTIAENIARMHPYPDAEAVVAAARLAGAHEIIVRLPGGYDARIGEGGAVLSAGQRQRIALARALFGDPFLLVLDEPNSNLDAAGEAALQRAINASKRRGAIVILIVHHQSSLVECDKVLVLMNGIQQAFGSRDSVLSEMSRKFATAAHGNLRVVADSKVRAE